MRIPVCCFLLGTAALLYFTIGYPILLAVIARNRPHPIRKSPLQKTVTVLLCVRDGEKWITQKLRSILSLNYPRELMEILVVSDGSTDSTERLAEQFAGRGVRLLRTPGCGKADAINQGVWITSGEIIFFTDVRQILHPDSLASLVSCFADPSVGAACGHVYFLDSLARIRPHLGLYWRYEKWIRRNLSRYDSLLAGTGCLYAMRRDLVVPVPKDTLLDDSYLPFAAFFRGYRFVLDEGAVGYEQSNKLASEFRRKVRTLAGIFQITSQYPALLTTRNRMFWHYVSYRLGRVLAPYALLTAVTGSWFMDGAAGTAFVGMEMAFGFLALLDLIISENAPWKILTSFPRTFLVLMGASLCAASIFFVAPRFLWKSSADEFSSPL